MSQRFSNFHFSWHTRKTQIIYDHKDLIFSQNEWIKFRKKKFIVFKDLNDSSNDIIMNYYRKQIKQICIQNRQNWIIVKIWLFKTSKYTTSNPILYSTCEEATRKNIQIKIHLSQLFIHLFIVSSLSSTTFSGFLFKRQSQGYT